MDFVAATADVKVGDTIVTSGVDGIYPKGFVIGKVEQVDNGNGIYKAISVRPSVEFNRLEEVLVVKTPPAQAAQGGDALVRAVGIALVIIIALALQTSLARFLTPGGGPRRSGVRRGRVHRPQQRPDGGDDCRRGGGVVAGRARGLGHPQRGRSEPAPSARKASSASAAWRRRSSGSSRVSSAASSSSPGRCHGRSCSSQRPSPMRSYLWGCIA